MYNIAMSLIACTDKNKKHRVNASGDLQRIDYYCPHRGCNAILTLVDCDDDVKSDYFRVKSGFQHIENCPYTKNDVYLLDNGFTNIENQTLTTALNKIDGDFKFLLNQIASFQSDLNLVLSDILKKELASVGYDPQDKTSLNRACSKIAKISRIVEKYSISKFKYDGAHDDGLFTYSLPFLRIKVYEGFFDDRFSLISKCTDIFKIMLYQYWYSKNWGDFYFRLFSHSYDEIQNTNSVEFFETIEECAEAFAKRYNPESIKVDKEYWSVIYECKDRVKGKYYYSQPKIGFDIGIDDQEFEGVHTNDLPVADVHTHGAYSNDLGDEVFSPKDLDSLEEIKNNYTKSFISYLVTPNGSFKKTDGITQTLVSRDMPKDENDPIKSITVDILYNSSSGEYCKVPLNIKGREDLIIDTNLNNLL